MEITIRLASCCTLNNCLVLNFLEKAGRVQFQIPQLNSKI